MAKKSQKNSVVSKITAKVSPTRAFSILFVALFAIIGATYVFASSAAAPLPKGTLAINSSSNLTYGGKVVFDVAYTGKVGAKAYIQVSLNCLDASGAMVVQGMLPVYGSYMTTNLQPSATLSGEGSVLGWNGQQVNCTAVLMYRSDSTGKMVIKQISSPVYFTVTAAN